MKCPACQHLEDKVLESRALQEFEITRRRRECLACGHRYTTHERIEEQPLMVLKKNGGKELFDKEKIERGLIRAFVKRPFRREVIEGIVHALEKDLREQRIYEIASEELGAMTLERLRPLDDVAYIRFASVYKKFETAQEFITEVQSQRMMRTETISHMTTRGEL